jgi:hypothetical protein
MNKKIPINFNNFWPWLNSEAERQTLNKGEWMKKSGLGNQRYIEFARACGTAAPEPGKKERDISIHYFYKLIGGLTLAPEQVEKKSGMKFSVEQRRMLQFQAFTQAQEDLIIKLMDDPDALKICRAVVKLDK